MSRVEPITGSLELDPNPYISGLTHAAKATEEFKGRVEGVQFAGFNRGIFATTSLLYGLNRIISSMSRGMEEYTNVLARIGTVADLTSASVQALADSMKEVSTAYGVSRTDIMGGMYTAAQSRYSTPSEMRAMASNAALLSHASGREISVKKATDLMSVSRQALGIGMDSVTTKRLSDILLRARDVGRWELGEMASAIGVPITLYGNLYRGHMGGDEILRELLTIMSTATLSGLSPQRAATGARRVVERTVQLSKPGSLGDPLREALRDLGYTSSDPIMEALGEGAIKFIQNLGHITQGSPAALGRMGFGSRDMMILTSLLRGGGEQLRRTHMDLDYEEIMGTSDLYGDKMKGSYEYARNQLRAEWNLTSQEFMQASIPLISQFTDVLAGLNRVARAMPDSAKSLIMLVGGLTSLRLAMNFLGVRGSVVGGMLSPQGIKSAFPMGVGSGPTKTMASRMATRQASRSAAMAASMGATAAGVTPAHKAATIPGFVPPDFNVPQYPPIPKGLKFRTLEEVKRHGGAIVRGEQYVRLRDASGRFTSATSTDPLLPLHMENAKRAKYGLPLFSLGGTRQPTKGMLAAPRWGSTVGLASYGLGMYGGMALGERIEGPDGSGMIPMIGGMIGGQMAANFGLKAVNAYASGGMGALMGRVGGAAMTGLRASPYITAMLVGAKIAGGMRKGDLFADPDEELRFLLRDKSESGFGRALGREWWGVGNVLPNRVKEAFSSNYVDRDRYRERALRNWELSGKILTQGEIANRYSMLSVLPSMKEDLASMGLMDGKNLDVGKLIADERFKESIKKVTDRDFGDFWGSVDRISTPMRWGDQVRDAIQDFVTAVREGAEAAERALDPEWFESIPYAAIRGLAANNILSGRQWDIYSATNYDSKFDWTDADFYNKYNASLARLDERFGGFALLRDGSYSDRARAGIEGQDKKWDKRMGDDASAIAAMLEEGDLYFDKMSKVRMFAGALSQLGTMSVDEQRALFESLTGRWVTDDSDAFSRVNFENFSKMTPMDFASLQMVAPGAQYASATEFGTAAAYNELLQRDQPVFEIKLAVDKMEGYLETLALKESDVDDKIKGVREKFEDMLDSIDQKGILEGLQGMVVRSGENGAVLTPNSVAKLLGDVDAIAEVARQEL